MNNRPFRDELPKARLQPGYSVTECIAMLQAQIDQLYGESESTGKLLSMTNDRITALSDAAASPATLARRTPGDDKDFPPGDLFSVSTSFTAETDVAAVLREVRQSYYKVLGRPDPVEACTAPTVPLTDLKSMSLRMEQLFDTWALTLATSTGVPLNPEVIKYVRDSVVGLREVMDGAVDEVMKKAQAAAMESMNKRKD